MNERVEEIILRETQVSRIIVEGVRVNFGAGGGGGRYRVLALFGEEVEGTLGVKEM